MRQKQEVTAARASEENTKINTGTASVAVAKQISVDAAVTAVLTEFKCIFTLKEKSPKLISKL